MAGVTGGRATNQSRVQGLIKLLREVTADAKSVAVGFGVSGPEQVRSYDPHSSKHRSFEGVLMAVDCSNFHTYEPYGAWGWVGGAIRMLVDSPPPF